MTLQYQQFVGRPFLLGVRDCYSMVRDVYDASFGIKLTDYARPNDWASELEDIIRNVYERDGFNMIVDWKAKDLRPADLLCMAVGETKPNHLAVYAGDNKVVQHLYGRLSSEDPFRDFFRNTTSFVLRHPDVPDLRPQLPSTSIKEILRDRYRVQPA